MAVVDDDEQSADTTAGILDEAGFRPSIVTRGQGPFQSTSELIATLRAAGCDGAICDHRLRPKGLATFTGAEAVAEMYQHRLPAALLSTFAAIDGDSSIRMFRSRIPVVIDRERLNPDEVSRALLICQQELSGTVSAERQTRRALIRAVGVAVEGGISVVDAVIHVWNPDRAVRFPRDLIEPENIRQLLPNDFAGELRLFARINVGCRADNDLYFTDFELAPEAELNEL